MQRAPSHLLEGQTSLKSLEQRCAIYISPAVFLKTRQNTTKHSVNATESWYWLLVMMHDMDALILKA